MAADRKRQIEKATGVMEYEDTFQGRRDWRRYREVRICSMYCESFSSLVQHSHLYFSLE